MTADATAQAVSSCSHAAITSNRVSVKNISSKTKVVLWQTLITLHWDFLALV